MRALKDKSSINEKVDIKVTDKSGSAELVDEQADYTAKESIIRIIKKTLEGFSIDDVKDIIETVEADINLETKYIGNKKNEN